MSYFLEISLLELIRGLNKQPNCFPRGLFWFTIVSEWSRADRLTIAWPAHYPWSRFMSVSAPVSFFVFVFQLLFFSVGMCSFYRKLGSCRKLYSTPSNIFRVTIVYVMFYSPDVFHPRNLSVSCPQANNTSRMVISQE